MKKFGSKLDDFFALVNNTRAILSKKLRVSSEMIRDFSRKTHDSILMDFFPSNFDTDIDTFSWKAKKIRILEFSPNF